MLVNSSAVEELHKSKGVDNAVGYDTYYTETDSTGVRRDITVTTLTDGIDEPYIVSGRLPENGKNEIIIDTVSAEKFNLKTGDTVAFDISAISGITLSESGYDIEYKAVPYEFTVCGTYHSVDVIYKVNMMNTSAATDSFIMGIVPHGVISPFTDDAMLVRGESVLPLSMLYKDVDVFTSVAVIGDNVDYEKLFSAYTITAENFENILQNPTAPCGLYKYSLTRDSFPSVTAFDAVNDTIAALAAVLPAIFFAVAAAITVISLSKTVDNQRNQIGIMQAIGVSKGSIYFSYICYALIACIIGGSLGGVVGVTFVPWLLNYIYAGQFCMPPTTQNVSVAFLFLGVAISAVLACLSAFISCYKTLKVAPSQAMRPKPPKKTKRILVERWSGLWKRLGFGAKMNLRNMFLHKAKLFLSSIGIIGCLALLIALVGLKDNMSQSFKIYSAQTGYDLIITASTVQDVNDGSLSSQIVAVDGVDKVTPVPAFSGRFSFGDKTSDLTVMAIPNTDGKVSGTIDENCVRLYSDVNGKNRISIEPDTFVLPEMTADKLGVKVGDGVSITGYALDNTTVDIKVVVTDIACEYFDQKAYCSYDLFTANGITLLADTLYASVNGDNAIDVATALKDVDGVRDVTTFKEHYDALQKKMSLLDYAVIIFVVGAAALAIAVIYNITATNLKERTREIATLMVLGYKRRETANMLIAENMVITAIGCVIGLPLGYGLLVWLVGLTRAFNVFISSVLSWYVVLGCIGLTFLFSLIATLLLNTKMKNISMVESLKSVE